MSSNLNIEECTILIIDDNPTNLGVIVDYLEEYGFEIMVARDGLSGIKMMEHTRPDLILLDIMMPGLNGFETCRRLKRNPETQEIPVIFMTALTDISDKVKGFEVGGVDYITKPIQQAEVLARINTHLKIRNLTKTLQEQTDKLQESNFTLAKRALDLEISSQVGRHLTSILNKEQLLKEIVNLIQSKFDYYFVAVWILNEDEDCLTLKASAGPLKQDSLTPIIISLNTTKSIIATACKTKRSYLADDVLVDANYLPHPELPQTQSELALLLHIGPRTIGILDIQSDQKAAFEPVDQKVLQMLADQISIALRNAQLYEQTENLRLIEQKKKEELARLNADKDKFFSIVAHDLRGPFHPLLTLAELLPDMIMSDPPEKLIQTSETIYQSAQNIYRLLENLLQWSRLQRGVMQYQPIPIDVKQMVDQNIRLLRQNAINKDITMHNHITNNLLMYADENLLNTVVRNLLSNALKFTPHKGQVTVSAKINDSSNSNKFIEISITDTGIGISPQDQEKLFKIGVHHSTPGTNNERGTGLGLIICREMVVQNSGEIWVESTLGEGTTIKFTGPLDTSIANSSATSDVSEDNFYETSSLLIAPPLENLNRLLKFAHMGSMQGIQSEVAELEKEDSKFTPFANKLRQMARKFEDTEIISFVEQLMKQ